MKRLKKALSMLCAAAMMVSALSMTAWAAPANITLEVNGENVVLTDAAPQAKNGRTFIPVRAAFEALGAEITWDQATKSVLAVKGEDTVTMTIGSTTAQVTRDGKTEELQMDVAPFAEGGRTYVPVRFAAQAFSCAVGWDGTNRTVMIVDVVKLLEDYTFDNLDGWMQASLKQEVPNPAKTTGKMDLSLQMPDVNGDVVTYPLSASFAAVSTDTKAQLQLEADFAQLMNLLGGADLTAKEKADLAKLCRANVDTRMDLNSGKVYFNLDCPLMSEMDETYDSTLWYLLDMVELSKIGGADFDYAAYIAEIRSMKDDFTGMRALLVAMLSSMELSETTNYEALSLSAGMICTLLSDQAMVKQGSNYVADYGFNANGVYTSLKMTYTTRGDLLTGAKMELSMKDAYDEISFLFDVKDDGKNTSMTLTLDAGEELKVNFSMTAQTVKSATQPAVEPPAGAQIVDLMDSLYGGMPDDAAA